jgi:hypothetical protein
MRASPDDSDRRARLGFAATPPPTDVRKAALAALPLTVLGAMFPRLSYRLRWVTRAGPRGVAANLAMRFVSVLTADAMMRLFARQAIERRDIEARLRKELGRPPWPGEIHDAWLETLGFDPDEEWLR